MADGYLEKHQQEYEARKAKWLQKMEHRPKTKPHTTDKGEENTEV